MIGIITVTHGEYGETTLTGSELIMGEWKNIRIFGLYLGGSVEYLRGFILWTISYTREGSEISILTDVCPGSPLNATASLMKDRASGHLVGVNLSISLEILCSGTQMELKVMIVHIVSEGTKTLAHVDEMLEEG